jgi:hypothetical protein
MTVEPDWGTPLELAVRTMRQCLDHGHPGPFEVVPRSDGSPGLCCQACGIIKPAPFKIALPRTDR